MSLQEYSLSQSLISPSCEQICLYKTSTKLEFERCHMVEVLRSIMSTGIMTIDAREIRSVVSHDLLMIFKNFMLKDTL